MKKTKKTINTILKSLAGGSSIVDACRAVDIDYTTLYKWQRSDSELDAQINAIKDSRVLVVEDVLFKRLVNGTASPAEYIFYLKNRNPSRWRDKIETVHKGNFDITIKELGDEVARYRRESRPVRIMEN